MAEGNSGLPSTSNNNNSTLIPSHHVAFDSDKDPLKLKVIPSSECVLKGVVNSIQVLFQIKTDKLADDEATKRPPIDLAIVLDRSGSMSGTPLENSKEAIKQVIDNLTPQDRLHFIAYATQVDVLFENGDLTNKDSLRNIVNGLQTKDCTNLGGGLEKAAEVLEKYKDNSQNRLQRIYLFSDGLVNEGKYRSHPDVFGLVRSIHDKNISVCAFGLGKDFDEDLMKGIAEYGGSYYFYIETAEKIEKYVGAALGGLLGIIGRNAVLKVRGKNGGVVKKIYAHKDVIAGAVIGDIKQSNIKNILVELEVTPKGEQEKEEVMTYQLKFLRKGDEEVDISGCLELTTTDDDSKLIQNIETTIALTIQQSAEFDENITTLLEQNKVAEAKVVKKQEIELLRSVVGKDDTGRIQSLLTKAEKSLNDLETKSSKHNLKQAKYHGHLKRMDSADWLDLQ